MRYAQVRTLRFFYLTEQLMVRELPTTVIPIKMIYKQTDWDSPPLRLNFFINITIHTFFNRFLQILVSGRSPSLLTQRGEASHYNNFIYNRLRPISFCVSKIYRIHRIYRVSTYRTEGISLHEVNFTIGVSPSSLIFSLLSLI